ASHRFPSSEPRCQRGQAPRAFRRDQSRRPRRGGGRTGPPSGGVPPAYGHSLGAGIGKTKDQELKNQFSETRPKPTFLMGERNMKTLGFLGTISGAALISVALSTTAFAQDAFP